MAKHNISFLIEHMGPLIITKHNFIRVKDEVEKKFNKNKINNKTKTQAFG